MCVWVCEPIINNNMEKQKKQLIHNNDEWNKTWNLFQVSEWVSEKHNAFLLLLVLDLLIMDAAHLVFSSNYYEFFFYYKNKQCACVSSILIIIIKEWVWEIFFFE